MVDLINTVRYLIATHRKPETFRKRTLLPLHDAAIYAKLPESELINLIELGFLPAQQLRQGYWIESVVLDIWSYTAQGKQQLDTGNPANAITLFTQVLELDPGDANAYLLRAKAYYQQGKLQPATLDFAEALRLNPSHIPFANIKEYMASSNRIIGADGELIHTTPTFANIPRLEKTRDFVINWGVISRHPLTLLGVGMGMLAASIFACSIALSAVQYSAISTVYAPAAIPPTNAPTVKLIISPTLRPIATVAPSPSPVIIPDLPGEILFVAADGKELQVIDNRGSRRFLTGMHYSQPGWSPDGRQLVFKGSGYVSGFFVTNADGTGIRIITSSENDYHPRLSPDNQYIVFSRDISSAYVAQRHIYMMGIDGSYLRCLTQIWVEATPTPLPRDTNGTSRERNIIMTVRPEHKFNDDPDWSPDGNTIVFTSYSGAAYADRKNGQIYSVKVDGTDLKRLTNNAYNDQHPVWSPDGKRIAFSSSRDRANSFEIYTMDKDGRNLHLMTDLKSGKALYPTWSPDSKYIAFEYNDGLDQWGSIRVLRVDEAPESFLIAQTMIGHEHIQPVWKPK